MQRKLVIAGNVFQANEWIKKDCNRRSAAGDRSVSISDYIVVTDPTRIRGIRDPHGVLIGTWRERKDVQELIEILFLSSVTANKELERVRTQIRLGI
jgi:hypothetical protein